MDTRLFTIRQWALRRNETIADFPVSFWEATVGRIRPGQFHTHDSMELALITAGTGIHILDNQRTTVREGDVLLIYPNHRHYYEECESLSMINIMYDPARLPIPILDGARIPLFKRFFPQSLSHLDFRISPEPILRFEKREDLEHMAEEARLLGQELNSKAPGNMLASTIQLAHIVLRLLRLCTPMVEDEKEIRVFPLAKIMEFINKNFTGNISLEKLVKMSFYSRSTFQHKFKELTGYGVGEYVLRKRIALAQELLKREPDRPIGEVGFDCGFLDSNYFCRKFRKVTGMSPRTFRKAKETVEKYVK